MREAKKILQHVLIVTLLSVAAGVATRLPLFRQFLAGEFRESFIARDRYPGIRFVSLQEAEDVFAAPGASVFIDARPAGVFRDGHIPGAKNVPYAAGATRIPAALASLPRNTGLLIYCEGGECQSSQGLAKLLAGDGFTNIRILAGGWDEWARARLPTERGDD